MSTKLTLTIDQKIIEQAKRYARAQGRSLSGLIEDYLKVVTQSERQRSLPDLEATPHTDSLLGVLRSLGPDFDEKKARREALTQKYLK